MSKLTTAGADRRASRLHENWRDQTGNNQQIDTPSGPKCLEGGLAMHGESSGARPAPGPHARLLGQKGYAGVATPTRYGQARDWRLASFHVSPP